MPYCVHCKAEKEIVTKFKSPELGEYYICNDCLDGPDHDWFRHMMCKGHIREADPNEPYWKKCEKELEEYE